MKVRKLAVALALAGGLGSGVAQALGLGEIELQSYLNEPMEAEIVLPQSRGVDPGDVFVNIAPEMAYQRLGLQRSPFVGKLRFSVVTGADGSLMVNVTSQEPLREPYLNFLLELTWPNGRLMREYAVLVDPPVYAEESGVSEQVRAPSAQARTTAPARSAESARRQTSAGQVQSRGYGSDTFGPTGANDTLWTIASAVRPDNSLSMQQVMLALQDLNPDAFIGNNINRLKRGQVLRVPTADQIRNRSRAEATRAVAQQNQEFQQPKRTVDATPAQPSGTGATGQASAGGDELKLLVADDTGSRSEADGGSAGGDGKLPGGVDAGTAVAMEELESARRENEELNTRVDDLQDQVQTLQRLLELKNSQLAEMQQGAGTGSVATDQAAPGSDLADATANTGESTTDSELAEAAPDTADPMAETEPKETGDFSVEDGAEETVEAPAESGTEEVPSDESDVAGMEAISDAEIAGEEAEVAETVPGAQLADDMTDAEQDMDSAGSDAAPMAAAQPEQPEKSEAPEAKPKPEPVADKGFPGNVIDAIANNTLYQIALGGGLVILLLVLLLLARRNANREKEFYEQLNSEPGGSDDTFDLSLDDDEPAQSDGNSDALEEADTYIAYGRYDQATQVLEAAISREPSRTDLRLKLLAVYADNQERDSFEKQFGEIETLGDDEALAQANELRTRLEEAESMPSIDDLESQLRSGSSLSDELVADQYDAGREEQVENEFGDFDSDLSDFDSDTVEGAESAADAKADDETGEGEKNESDDLIEYDLSGLELPKTKDEAADPLESDVTGSEQTPESDLLDEESDFSSLEIDLDDPEDSLEESLEGSDLDESSEKSLEESLGELDELSGFELNDEFESETSLDELENELESDVESKLESDPEAEDALSSDLDALDESFLDELDAELDKVAGEEEGLGGSEMEESTLDDLELDVSDEDLALMEEFSDSADSANAGLEDKEPSLDDLDDELELGDALSEDADGSLSDVDESVPDVDGSLADADGSLADSDDALPDEDLPVASDEVKDEASKSPLADIDEDDIGDDDDFDFLAGTDEAATKLDLARAYIEMGDSDGARDILEEVALEGDDGQKAEAQDLLKKLS
ncbi:FimV/HubP family polar landmark protein [Marinobacter sp.]|uniref:FimV/HubP family polar landmark protein n=1 Tax=Marinobacter sp. TaxID=50741 RepID=UPI003A93B701